MPSHMSTIGFQTRTQESFSRLAMQAVKAGKIISLPIDGSYRLWSPGEGIELWIQIDPQGQIIGLNPHFSGKAAPIQVGLMKRVKRPTDNNLDGAFYGWVGASENNIENGQYPVVFDTPDYRTYDTLNLPGVAHVQFTAFAHELKAFDDEQALRASGSRMAAESFIPSGTFYPDGKPIDPPKSEAIFYGHVLETSVLTNPFTQNLFYWAKVQTLGGEFDVVADPEVVKGTIVKGSIVGGHFWISARLR